MKLTHPQKRLGPRGFLACALGVNMLVIMAIDMYAPALPGMTRELGVSASTLNLTMFAFFFTSALGVFVAGPLSDRLGRRPVLVGASALFAAGSLGCALTPGVAGLVAFRVLQALGFGSITAVETALIKDAFDGHDLQVAMTLLQSLIIVGPVVAPFLGTFVLTVGGWREVFVVLTVFGLIALVLALLLSETLPPEARLKGSVADSLRQTVRTFGALLRGRRFRSLSSILGLIGMPYAAFLAVVSYVLLDDFGMSYLGYSCTYAAVAAVSVSAPFVYMALSRKLSINAILRICMVACAASAVGLLVAGRVSPIWFAAMFMLYVLAEGVVRPMSFVVLLDQPAERVGAASSYTNLVYSVLNSVGTVIGTFGWSSYVLGLGAIMAACTVAMIALLAAFVRAAR